MTSPGFAWSAVQPRFCSSSVMAVSMRGPPDFTLEGTFTGNSTQLNWNVGGAVVAVAPPDGADAVMTAEPRPTTINARNRSA